MTPVNPLDLTPDQYRRWERVQWTLSLVGAFRELRKARDKYFEGGGIDLYEDDDPAATDEMLSEVEALCRELVAELPPGEPAPPPADDDSVPY